MEGVSTFSPMTTGRYWHPFADMQAVNEAGEVVIDRADGYYVWDDEGRRYLDATASLWYCNVGHGRQAIVDAVAAQMSRLEAYSTFGDLTNPPVIELAERVTSLAPIDDALLFLTSGGSDSIDTAVKLARRYFQVTGQPQRRYVIGRKRGYHGMHVAGTSIGGIEPNVDGYGELPASSSGTHTSIWRRPSRSSAPRTSPPSCASRSSARAGCSPRPRPTWRRPGSRVATPASCSSPTRWSRGSAEPATGSRASGLTSTPT
jgi:adenosylmethionine-8-amino-7-oxononanoate aminotransferase